MSQQPEIDQDQARALEYLKGMRDAADKINGLMRGRPAQFRQWAATPEGRASLERSRALFAAWAPQLSMTSQSMTRALSLVNKALKGGRFGFRL